MSLADTAIRGRVLRSVGGFYRVAVSEGRIIECHLSGRVKTKGRASVGAIIPGDIVTLEESEGVTIIREAHPRSTHLIRPNIANVDICVIVQSAANPSPNLELIDRLLVHAHRAKLTTMICITKADLAEAQEIDRMLRPYKDADYQCFTTSAKMAVGVSELTAALAEKISILAGPSGVGKSRLLNALCPAFERKTGEVSEKIARGRHTTRHVELLPLPHGGWIADSPGFSIIDFIGVSSQSLPKYYPEFEQLGDVCKFNSCLHRGEPGCVVADAVAESRVDIGRYQRYLRFLKEIEDNEIHRY
jgi:ribosome biogenesis GTPase